MKKIKLQICYQYLGDKIGSVPFIDVKYVTEDDRELDALTALDEKRLSYIIPNTQFFIGKTDDGEEFKVENYNDIPHNAVYPVGGKGSDFYDIEDYKFDDIEITVKQLATESNEDAIRYSYCNFENDSYLNNTTKNLDEPELKNALISKT